MSTAGPSRSRQRLRRAPSSDIEEDGPSQARNREVEDVEMDEEVDVKPRRMKKGKKEKKKNTQADDSDGDPPDEEEEDVPVPEIGDHPLDKSQAGKIKNIAGDWTMTRDDVYTSGLALAREIAVAIAEFTEGEKSEKALVTIDELMRELVDTEHELLSHEKTLNELYQKLSRGDQIVGVVQAYEDGVTETVAAYKQKTSRQKYAKNDQYQKFKQAIYEVQNPDSAMPPLVDLIPREDGDDSDDDDDVQVGGVTQDYKCPLSLTYLIEPLTSKLCGHSYSKPAIREYLGYPGRLREKECPATGCRKVISMKDLQDDLELARRAKQAERRERARDDESADEEIID